jgi:hypothetical protein
MTNSYQIADDPMYFETIVPMAPLLPNEQRVVTLQATMSTDVMHFEKYVVVLNESNFGYYLFELIITYYHFI